MKATCPNDPTHLTFTTKISVVEEWRVTDTGHFVERINDDAPIEGPSLTTTWVCDTCGDKATIEETLLTREYTWERIQELLLCVFDDGAQCSWYRSLYITKAPYDYHHLHIIPTLADGEVCLRTDDAPDSTFVLNRGALKKGLEVMAKKYPRHTADFLTGNEDAETGDAFLQCCVFGDIWYPSK